MRRLRGIRYQVDLLPNRMIAEGVQRLHSGDFQRIEVSSGIWRISQDGRKLSLAATGYDVGVESLRIHPLATTRMTCPDLKIETRFLKALNKTWGYRVAGRRLELLDEHDAVLAELEERNL